MNGGLLLRGIHFSLRHRQQIVQTRLLTQNAAPEEPLGKQKPDKEKNDSYKKSAKNFPACSVGLKIRFFC